MTTWCLQK